MYSTQFLTTLIFLVKLRIIQILKSNINNNIQFYNFRLPIQEPLQKLHNSQINTLIVRATI